LIHAHHRLLTATPSTNARSMATTWLGCSNALFAELCKPAGLEDDGCLSTVDAGCAILFRHPTLLEHWAACWQNRSSSSFLWALATDRPGPPPSVSLLQGVPPAPPGATEGTPPPPQPQPAGPRRPSGSGVAAATRLGHGPSHTTYGERKSVFGPLSCTLPNRLPSARTSCSASCRHPSRGTLFPSQRSQP